MLVNPIFVHFLSGPCVNAESNDISSSNDPPSPVDAVITEEENVKSSTNGSNNNNNNNNEHRQSQGPRVGCKPLTPILNTGGNKERRQGRVNTVSISENISSPIKNLSLDISAAETQQRFAIALHLGLDSIFLPVDVIAFEEGLPAGPSVRHALFNQGED